MESDPPSNIQKNISFINESVEKHPQTSGLYTFAVHKIQGTFADEYSQEVEANQKDWKTIFVKITEKEVSVDEKKLNKLNKEAVNTVKNTIEELKQTKKQAEQEEGERPSKKLKGGIQTDLLEKEGEKLNENQIAQNVKNILRGSQDWDSEEPLSQYLHNLLIEKFSSPEPVTDTEIQEIYKLLFETTCSEESQLYIENRNHPFSIVYYLVDSLNASQGGKTYSEPENGSVNNARFLSGTNEQILWVFKPVSGETTDTLNKGISPGTRSKREHVAFLLNFHQKFPIPFCMYVQIGKEIGAIQVYEQGGLSITELEEIFASKEKEEEKTESKEAELGEEMKEKSEKWLAKFSGNNYNNMIELISLQDVEALVVFDLLCGNCDRNVGNFLFMFDEKNLFLKGIDHGECFSGNPEATISIDLLDIFPQTKLFFTSTSSFLVSQENENKYAQIMKIHDMEGSVPWMQITAQVIRKVIEDEDPLSIYEVAQLLMQKRTTLLQQQFDISVLKDYFTDIATCKEIFSKAQSLDTALSQVTLLKLEKGDIKIILEKYCEELWKEKE